MIVAAEISFDGWTLRAATGELTREGATQRLTQQPLRILVELLEHPGEVVTRERLVELLWPKGVLDYDNGLNVAVRKLRVALGDDTDTPRYIETLPRIGYRFVGKLDRPAVRAEPEPALAPPKPARSPRPWIIAAVALVAFAAVGTLLVLRKSPGEPEVTVGVKEPIVARRTTSARAYEHYLQGIYNRSRRDIDGTELAIKDLEAALAEDPEYAAAHAGLSDTLTGAAVGHRIPASEAFERARKAAQRAVELDPGIAEGHSALGQVYMFFDRNYAAAEAEYEKARVANEGYARLWHHLGTLRAFQGRTDEALAAMRRARELEPMTLLYSSNYGLILYHARRYDDAITHVRALLESQPSLDQARSVLIRALVAKGDYDGAAQQLSLRVRDIPNLSDAGLVFAHSGQRDKALLEIERLKKMSESHLGVGYELAVIHAALGDVPGGCEALELAWQDHSPFLGWMRIDPRMDPLREAPCYAQILGRFK
jgi:DNA-binding winged helix-turn-helix (wHTH) protein/tetratricopeptide (TPR) repeat protein